MTIPDYAKAIQEALVADWAAAHPTWDPVLEVDEDFDPEAGRVSLLVADDTGPAVFGGAWNVGKSPRRPLLRVTAFANGRTLARQVVVAAADFVVANKPGISRVEDVSAPLLTQDRDTGAELASITMPVIVRQLTA